ncbi:MAG: magnesium transporter CorA family protein [Saprospiraceae bacterium]|nr:magnesium transporter CorA family protein [Saprospiraceae bacterium]
MIETINIGNLKWHHLLNPSDENLDFLQTNFDFHPLDIEDCRSKVQRPKVDIYDDYYFLILHFPYFDKANKFLKTKEVKIFWGKGYIITIGKSHWVIKNLFERTKENPNIFEDDEMIEHSSDGILYKILEALMKEMLTLLNRIGTEIDQISTGLFNKRAEKTIERISFTRKNIILLDTIFKPQLRLFHKFESGDIKGYAENMEDYWGNILDYYQKMWDMTEDYDELVEGFSKTFDSMQANRTNEIMKILTFFSTILLPLTFITGLYGMNIGLPLSGKPGAFWIIIGSMATIATVLIIYFKRRKWL